MKMPSGTANSKSEEELLVCTFVLGDGGMFGIDAPLIQEVVMKGEITPVRHAPDFVAGIRNLRGRIITVIDLCVRLGLGAVNAGPESRVLIAGWRGELVGLLVDRVADAVAIRQDDLERPPSNLQGVQMQKLRGVFRTGGRLAALLDLEAVLGGDDRNLKPICGEES
jgi:purine-binding chemotaxis protein CheW